MKIALYFGDCFWSTVPYQGLSLYYELSKQIEVLPIFNTRDIRLHKKWRGDEKFWFNTDFFKDIPFIESSDLPSTLQSHSIKHLIMSSQMQEKSVFANRNLSIFKNGCNIYLYDCGGGDFVWLNSKSHPWWNKFFIKSDYFKKCLIDPNIGVRGKKFYGVPLGDPRAIDIIPSGCLEYDELSPEYEFPFRIDVLNKEQFCKKYNLDVNKKIISYMPGNPGPNHKYRKLLSELNNLLLELQVDFNYQVCFKSHPNDYISSENTSEYSSIHPRAQRGGYPRPRYLCEGFDKFTTIEAQDGYNLYRCCDFGVTDLSHAGFELATLNKKCFSYKMKDYEFWSVLEELSSDCYIDCGSTKELKEKILNYKHETTLTDADLNNYFFTKNGNAYKNIAKNIRRLLA